MLSLLLALLLQPDTKHWVPLSNLPGWEGYGTVLPSGWIDPEKFRRVADPTVEVPPARPQTLSRQRPAPRSESATENPGIREIPGTDPYGFLGWLNGVRSRHGLGFVAWDQNLAAWAADNSSHGFAHTVMGPARRQNVGVGELWSVCSAWLGHGPHAAALLDPSIRWVGLAVVGGVWTYSAY